MANRPLKVLHITHGGMASDFFPNLARLHDRSRFKFYLAHLGLIQPAIRERELRDQGVETFDLRVESRKSYGSAAIRLRRLIRHCGADIVNTHLFDPSLLGLTVAAIDRRVTRVWSRHHSDLHFVLDKRLHVRLDRYCGRLAHAIVANSEYTKRVMVDREAGDSKNITVIHYGLDTGSLIQPAQDDLQKLRSHLKLPEGRVITIAGRLARVKGHDTLIRALAMVDKHMVTPVTLLIAGVGPLEDDLQRLVHEEGVAHSVKFLGFREDVEALFALSDLVIVPSIEEAFGQVVIEAMAVGTPVIASRVGGMPEIVVHQHTGLLFQPGDVEGLANSIVTLLQDSEHRRAMGHAARTRILESFDARAMVNAYEELYERLVTETSRL